MAGSSVSDVSTMPAHAATSGVGRRPNPLATVVRWELRRLSSSRTTWILAGLVFTLSCLIELGLASNDDSQTLPSVFGPRTITVDWLSNYGVFHTWPTYLGVVLALFVPFVCADGVAMDIKRRTHEIVMGSALPSWAYLWGRYLIGLLMSLALACLMIVALLVVAVVRHQVQPDVAVTPDLGGVATLFAMIALPPVVVLSSMSFALGTLWPQHTMLFKVGIVLGWLMAAPVFAHFTTHASHNVNVWDITSEAVAGEQATGKVVQQFAQQTQHLGTPQFLASWHALQQQLPDMSSWIAPRLTWIAFGIACLVLTTLVFHRFRDVQA